MNVNLSRIGYWFVLISVIKFGNYPGLISTSLSNLFEILLCRFHTSPGQCIKGIFDQQCNHEVICAKKKMIVDFFNNKPCPESATSFNAGAPIWYPHPLSLGDRGHQRLGMVENSFIVKMRVLIFLWFVAHISKILLMVYLFPPKVIRTETNMDIEAKSKIKI